MINMVQAKHPTFAEIRACLNYVNIDFARSGEKLLGFYVICRVYDRRFGNFKACGWHVALQYGSGWSGRTVSTVIFDADLARSMLT